jgi:hypothetical protein
MLATDHVAERFARPLARQDAGKSLVKIAAAVLLNSFYQSGLFGTAPFF